MKRATHKALLMVATLCIFVLGACSAGAVQTPNREVKVTVDEALAGQNAIFAGLATGKAQLTETQFSSLLTKLLEANSGPNNPVAQLTTWIEPEQLHIRVTLKEGVLPATLGNTLDLVGNVTVEKGALQIHLDEAAAGQFQIAGAYLQPLTNQINSVLAQQVSTLPLAVTLESGVLSLNLAQ